MHKNTLYITFDGLSDPLGQSQILPYLLGIASNGFHIHILSCEKKDRLEKEKATILQNIGNLPITWEYILYDPAAGTLSRLLYVRRILKMAKHCVKQKEIGLTHCRSYLASLIGLRLRSKSKIPFIFDMRGFWADERLDGGIWKKSRLLQNFFYHYFKRKEKQFLQNAGAIVSLTHAAVKELERVYPSLDLRRKTSVIPCCTDTSLFDKFSQTNTPKIPSLLPEDHLLIYTGSIGTWYYTREMIDCCLNWREQIPNLKLLILTKEQTELQSILSTYGEAQKSFVLSASCSHKDVASYLALAKAAIFFIKPAYSKIASSPTKMAECWSMGLPIITNPGIGDNDLYFKDHKGGVLVRAFNVTAYKEACAEYLSLRPPGDSYREIALQDFNTELAREKYMDIYERLAE